MVNKPEKPMPPLAVTDEELDDFDITYSFSLDRKF